MMSSFAPRSDVPPTATNCANLWSHLADIAGCPAARARVESLRGTRRYGRAFWKRWIKYHGGSRVEATMRCLRTFDERIAATAPECQTAEIHAPLALMKHFNGLGIMEIVHVA
jgi:hypothetical protein